LGIGGLTRVEIDRLMVVADFMAAVVGGPGSVDLAAGCILGTLFYEPSTRTSSSFQAAMLRLGGRVMAIGDVANSSVAKGETLEDTVRCLQCYCNILAMRHPETGSAARAAAVLDIPLINAGDGVGEHPTQALLDLYTMHGELGPVDGLTITMVGDLKNGRTVHSLSKLLLHFKCRLNFVSPDSLRMPPAVLDLLKEHDIPCSQHATLDEVMKDTDVLYGQIGNASGLLLQAGDPARDRWSAWHVSTVLNTALHRRVLSLFCLCLTLCIFLSDSCAEGAFCIRRGIRVGEGLIPHHARSAVATGRQGPHAHPAPSAARQRALARP